MTRGFVLAAAALLVAAALGTASRLPLFDPDEGYYPGTAAESVDRGAWWDLTFNGDSRWEKPILAYALIEGAFGVAGRNAMAARLPSALEGAALVILVGLLIGRITTKRAGTLTALVLSTTLAVQAFARAAHPEIALVMSMAVTELLLVMWLVVPKGERIRGWAVLTGLSLGYGLLAKGPVAAVVPLLGAICAAPLVTDVRARWLEGLRDALIAGIVALAIAAPWYAVMTAKYGTEFLRVAIWAQNVGRFSGQMEHGQSAGVFALATAAGLLPWLGLLPAAAWRIRRPRGDRREAARLTLAIMAVSSLAFYSLSASKLASYSLALIPPLAALIGLYLDDVVTRAQGSGAGAFRAAAGVLGALAAALMSVPLLLGDRIRARDLFGGVPAEQTGHAIWTLVTPVTIVFALGAIAVLLLPLRGRIAALAAVGVAAPLALLLTAAPVLDDAYPWRRFGAEMAATPGPAWIQNYRAPSLTFYARRPIAIVNDEQLAEVIMRAEPGWIVLGADWADKPPLAALIAEGRATVVDRSARLALVRITSPRVADDRGLPRSPDRSGAHARRPVALRASAVE